MNQLVFIDNEKVVTDSLTIAEVFKKRHSDVLRDIDVQISKLKEADEEGWGLRNFAETQYQHPQNKQWYPKYNLTEDAFTLVAMAYVTPEAMKMKVKFIQEFKRMREYIESQQQRKFTAREQLQLIMQANEETAQRVDVIEETVSEVKAEMEDLRHNLHITSSQAKTLRLKASQKVYEALGGKESNAFKHLRNRTYSACWREFWDYFDISEYRELPRVKYEEGLRFLIAWQPKTELRLEIEHYNTQMELKLVK